MTKPINPTLETSYELANLLKDVQTLQAQSETGNGGRDLDKMVAVVSLASSVAGLMSERSKNTNFKTSTTVIKLGIDKTLAAIAVAQSFDNLSKGNYSGAISNAFAAVSSSAEILAGYLGLIDNGKVSRAISAISLIMSSASTISEMRPEIGEGAYNFYQKNRKAINDIAQGKFIDKFFDKHLMPMVEKIIKETERFDKKVQEITKKLRDADTYDPTSLLEALLQPIADFGMQLNTIVDDGLTWLKKLIDGIDKAIIEFGELALDRFLDWLPDTFGDWRNLNRSGFHYFYDPLVLDLNGNGRIDTLGVDINNRSNNAFFDFDGDNSQGVMALAA